MGRFPQKVLLATDGSEDAARAARATVRLSGMSGSELHVVHVGSVPVAPVSGNAVVEVEELAAAAEQAARELLDREVERFRQEGAEVAEGHLRMVKVDEEVVRRNGTPGTQLDSGP